MACAIRWFPDQGSKLCSLPWKCGVLTTDWTAREVLAPNLKNTNAAKNILQIMKVAHKIPFPQNSHC